MSRKEIGLVSLDLETEAIVTHELRQLGYTIRKIDFSVAKKELNAIDLIIGIPLKSFDDSEFQKFSLGVSNYLPNTPSIITIESNNIRNRLKAYGAGITAVLDTGCLKKNIQNTLEAALGTNKVQQYKVLVVSDCEDFQLGHLQVLEKNHLVVDLIDDPIKLDLITSNRSYHAIIFRLLGHYRVCDYLKVLKEIEQFKYASLIVISNNDDAGNADNYVNKHADVCLSYPVNEETLLQLIISHAKKSNAIKLSNDRFEKYYYEQQREHLAFDKHALVSSTDASGTIIYVNNLFCQFSGYDAKALLGKNHRSFKSTRHDSGFFSNMWLTIAKGNTWQGEICNLRKDGSEYWVESTITAFLDANGKPYQYTAILTDVTEQKLAQIKLADTLYLLEKTNQTAQIGSWEYDTKHKQMSWSAQTKVLHEVSLYYKPHVKRVLDFYIEGPYRKNMETVFKRAIRDLIPFDQEFVIQTANNNKRWVRVVGTPETNQGKCIRVYGLFQDITEKKVVLLDLLTAKEEAEAASLAKTKFLSQMSHELRTPLNAILGFAQLLNQCDSLAADQYDDVGEILLAGRHLLKLINEVLDLSAIEAGRISFSFEPVSLEGLLKECCQLISPLAAEHRLSISNKVPGNIFVKADRGKLKQVIINLINNAIKYNHRDGFVIIRSFSDDLGYVVLEVENSGLSIESDKVSAIFRPFVRLDSNGSNVEGSGVGLSICKHLISLMGGSIGLKENQVDKNIFWVRLPQDYPNDSVQNLPIGIDNGNLSLVDYKPKRILYVEDNPANLKLVASILSHRKRVHFYTAHTPEIGFDLALKNNFDLILLDINLPGMSGFELMRKLKGLNGYREKPFVAISANAMPEDIENASASGFTDYITKPIDLCEFNQLIDELLV
jgi:PAS domain S-box-containing protein